jgi:tRNA pseudouridine55 synthase
MYTTAPNGVLLIDKPAGLSSAGVVRRIKKIAGIKKAGHTGTLDPLATGLMLCPINQATRISRFLMSGYKSYEALMGLGAETDTLDADGKIVHAAPVPPLTPSKVEAAAGRYQGEIEQVPPAYSALKHEGKPLYVYAREGVTVKKPARRVFIEKIAVTSLQPPEIGLFVRCSSGTYIRSLCADIGRDLGCGAYVKTLRRTECAGFAVSEARTIEELELAGAQGRLPDLVVPMARALSGMPTHVADKALTQRIKYGKILHRKDIDQMDEIGYTRVVDPEGNLLAVLYRDACTPDRLKYACVFPPA